MLCRIIGLDSFSERTGRVVVGVENGLDSDIGGGTKSAWSGNTTRLPGRWDARHSQFPRSSGHDCDRLSVIALGGASQLTEVHHVTKRGKKMHSLQQVLIDKLATLLRHTDGLPAPT